MEQLPNVLESKTKIRFQDCDPFNHLNNGNYINYFINHREDELINGYNIDMHKMAKKTGKSWVSSSNQIAYLKPAYTMETVAIQSQLIAYNDTELRVEMRMYNEAKTEIKAVIWCGFVHFNLLTQKRDQHSEDLMHLFKTVHTPINVDTFETRISQLKPKLAKAL
ncbi:acyl-CoA thioesterase [Seonamhaeicola marinus]|uniref:Acyl-CoA thioesterase n=1 Tax=Seonamhaeicola marinus TaxID=1912246 RepID=A0A5D0I6K2_9FLAO|nr:acyl-CoA thioesterase [Seonamhaeicola marinus]TYA78559.1 acyl-CoA thioesterase [Seonamhaeicola marinus]